MVEDIIYVYSYLYIYIYIEVQSCEWLVLLLPPIIDQETLISDQCPWLLSDVDVHHKWSITQWGGNTLKKWHGKYESSFFFIHSFLNIG